MKRRLIAALILVGSMAGQDFPDAPRSHSTRNLILANAAMYGSSIIGAHATSHGSHACAIESGKAAFTLPSGENIGLVHPYQTYLRRSLAIDAGISAFSFWAHKKHHNLLAVIVPSGAAGFQLGVAGMQYSAGCF